MGPARERVARTGDAHRRLARLGDDTPLPEMIQGILFRDFL
jgi:hypothetical protein